MTEEDQKRVKVRRRMRGIAVFFIVISLIGLAASILLIATGYRALSTALIIEIVLFIGGMLVSAVAAWNGSRVAAALLIVLLGLSPFLAATPQVGVEASDIVRSIVYVILALIMLASAIQYHRLSREGSQPLGGSRLLRWSGKIFAALIVIFMGFSASILLFSNSTAVALGSDLSEEHRTWLTEREFLLPSEKPLYYYLDGLHSIEEGGSLLTDKYVGGWWQEDGEVKSVWLQLGQVCRVDLLSEGGFLEDAIYSVHSPGDTKWVQLWLSIEDNMHKKFIGRLNVLNQRKMRPEIKVFCDENRPIDWTEIATQNGISPSIVDPEGVSEEQVEWLQDNEFLVRNERLLKFYSYGKFEISEGGSLLTDRYFGGWYQNAEGIQSAWIKIGSICSIEQTKQGDDETSLYLVEGHNGAWIELDLPDGDGQSEALIEQVLVMNSEQMTEETRQACDGANDISDAE